MEEIWIDTPCFRRFAGIQTMEGRIHDQTTILSFRHLLEEHGDDGHIGNRNAGAVDDEKRNSSRPAK